jgi:hypothetical protein
LAGSDKREKRRQQIAPSPHFQNDGLILVHINRTSVLMVQKSPFDNSK